MRGRGGGGLKGWYHHLIRAMISFSEARQIQCGGKIEDLSAFWKPISRVEQGWRDMISEMDQENFAEVDRDNCALKLTQRRKNRGKSNQVLFIKSKQNMHLGKRRDGGGGGKGGEREIDQWVKWLMKSVLSVQ